ncbi:MAG: hypothetical protein V1779_02900 [bacterium]
MSVTQNNKKVSQKIVEAWFTTVINPIIDGLMLVESYLNDNNYTWDWNYMDFIEIKNLISFFDFRAEPNFEQLTFIKFPELLDININYDSKRDEFNKSCIHLYECLLKSTSFKKIFNDKIDDLEKSTDISVIDIEYLRGTNTIKWLATYLINNKKNLPNEYIYKIIWNTEKEKFYEILNYGTIKEAFNEVNKKRLLFEEITKSSINTIKVFRNNLSLETGVPIFK